MKLFTKNKSEINITDKAAIGVANRILKSQRWFATSLDGLTKNWRQKQQWIFLYLICLVFGAMSIVAIIRPFRKSQISNTIIPKSISIPANVYQKDKTFLITRKELQQVLEYKSKYPNLMKERPGLYDSLNLIEEAYYSQQK